MRLRDPSNLKLVLKEKDGFKEDIKYRIKCGWMNRKKHSIFCMTKGFQWS